MEHLFHRLYGVDAPEPVTAIFILVRKKYIPRNNVLLYTTILEGLQQKLEGLEPLSWRRHC